MTLDCGEKEIVMLVLSESHQKSINSEEKSSAKEEIVTPSDSFDPAETDQ
jgi:hypothetical protein